MPKKSYAADSWLGLAGREGFTQFVLSIEGMKAVVISNKSPMPRLEHNALEVILGKR